MILINKILEVKKQHSHNKINSLSLRWCPSCRPDDTHAPLAPAYNYDFCHTRMKYGAIRRISVFSLITEMTSPEFGNGNLSRYPGCKWMQKYKYNETYSDIMQIAPTHYWEISQQETYRTIHICDLRITVFLRWKIFLARNLLLRNQSQSLKFRTTLMWGS